MDKSCYNLMCEVIEDICDNYCKWPEKYKGEIKDEDEAYDKLMAEKCENCPLNKLI